MAANRFRDLPTEINGVEIVKPKPVSEFLTMMGIDVNKPHSVRLESDRLIIFLNKK